MKPVPPSAPQSAGARAAVTASKAGSSSTTGTAPAPRGAGKTVPAKPSAPSGEERPPPRPPPGPVPEENKPLPAPKRKSEEGGEVGGEVALADAERGESAAHPPPRRKDLPQGERKESTRTGVGVGPEPPQLTRAPGSQDPGSSAVPSPGPDAGGGGEPSGSDPGKDPPEPSRPVPGEAWDPTPFGKCRAGEKYCAKKPKPPDSVPTTGEYCLSCRNKYGIARLAQATDQDPYDGFLPIDLEEEEEAAVTSEEEPQDRKVLGEDEHPPQLDPVRVVTAKTPSWAVNRDANNESVGTLAAEVWGGYNSEEGARSSASAYEAK